MSKHRIRLRRGDFSSQRIEKHKNYGQLLEQHQRSGRFQISNYLIGLIVLAAVVGISYYALERIENIQLAPTEPLDQHHELLKEVQPIEGVKETSPHPQQGLTAFYEYIERELDQFEPEVEGIVYVSFVVEVDGSLTEVRVLKGLCPLCDRTALNIVKNGPQWTPAIKGEKPVRAPMVIPVTFTLKSKREQQNPDTTGS